MSTDLIPTKPRAAAPFIAFGVGLSLAGVPLLLASAYAEITASSTRAIDEHPGMPFAVVGWVCVALGIAFAVVGAYRLAQHADRAAGVLYPAGGHESGWHEEKAAAAAAEDAVRVSSGGDVSS